MKWLSIFIVFTLTVMAVIFEGISKSEAAETLQLTQSSIHLSILRPQYQTYKSKGTLSLEGSDEDNLFQLENLGEQLDLLVSVRGNYVRKTMYNLDPGNEWPFLEKSEGPYDLEKWRDKITWIRKLVCIDKLISYNKIN